MKPSAKRAVSLLGSLALLFGSLLIFITFAVPAYGTVRELRGQYEKRADLLEEESAIIMQVNKVLAEYRGVAALRETVSLALPREENAAAIFTQLESIATLARVSLGSLGVRSLPERPQATGNSLVRPVKDIEISGLVTGSYEGLKAFLRYLETNVRVMDIDSLSLSRAGAPGANFYTMNLTLRAYYQ